MRAHHAHTAKALDVRVEPGAELWGWAGRTLGAPARTATGAPAWLRLVSAAEDKAAGKLWDGALDAQHAFGDLDGHRPALLAVHDTVDDGIAYRAELSVRVDDPVLSDDPILQHQAQLPDSWWNDLAGTLEKVAATGTGRVAVRQQYMERAIPEFVGIPAPAVPRWTTAHADVHWANLTEPLRLLDWEGSCVGGSGSRATLHRERDARRAAYVLGVRTTGPRAYCDSERQAVRHASVERLCQRGCGGGFPHKTRL
ncbi:MULTISPECIES: hypothetical protein [Streptomyces]